MTSTQEHIVGFTGKYWLPLLVFCSATRFQSMATLRLRLCGVDVVNYPMWDKHLFFLRTAGGYTFWALQLPCLVIVLTLIVSAASSEGSRTTVRFLRTFIYVHHAVVS